MTNSELRDLLELSIGREPVPPSPQEDLRRSQRAIRRRRVRTTLAGTGAVAATAFVMITMGGNASQMADGDSAAPGDVVGPVTTFVAPEWVPRASSYVPEELSDDQALARCNEVEYADSAGVPDALFITPDERPIYAGDSVEIAGPDDRRSSCTVPGSWSAPEPLPPAPDDSPITADDTTRILALCSQAAQIDLRNWVVAVAMADGAGAFAATLVTPDQRNYATCELGGAHRELWFSHHTTPAEARATPTGWGQLGLNSGLPCEALGGACQVRTFSRASILPAGVASVAIRLADTTVGVPVGVHGSYAVSLRLPRDAQVPLLEAYDAEGRLVLSCQPGECE